MRKISKKLALSIIALLSISAFSVLSFSLADENNGASDGTLVYAANSDYTQIDRIIENSHTGTYGDKNYNIIEITSDKSSSLKSLCENKGFKNYVIDGYRSIEQKMADGTVKYTSYSTTTDDDTLVAAIQNADMIYIHNDPSNNKLFSNTNDISEAVKLALDAAATADHKPFIIDSYNGTINNMGQAKNYNSLVSRTFNSSLATFGWPVTNSGIETIPNFMGMKVSSATYSRISGKNSSSVWQKFESTTEGKSPYTMAKVLTIGSSDSPAYDMTTVLKNGLSHEAAPSDVSAADKAILDDTSVLKFANTSELYQYGYVKAYAHPTYIKFETASSETDLSGYDLSSYDFIILESSLNGQLPTEASFSALSAAAYAKVHFLYSPSLKTMTNSQSSKENPAPGYAYVLNKVATPNDVARFNNVLVTNFAKMNIYSGANNSRTVKDIADIIINGSFRGINMNSGDDTSNVYTVLEIEPSYPVDTNLAKVFYDNGTYNLQDVLYTYKGKTKTFLTASDSRGTDVLFDKYGELSYYYLRTNGVLDATADEISYDGETPLSAYDGDQAKLAAAIDAVGNIPETQTKDTSKIVDYYNWTLSQAKIAHAVGKSYNQVKVVHMSSAEFNTSRVSLLDSYDAIYIGGDVSGLKEKGSWNNGGTYNMYFRNGDSIDQIAESNQSYRSNDISEEKLEEMKAYAGKLPIIVDKKVVDAIKARSGVDPQSNMYKAIEAAQASSKSLWNFDSTQTCKITNADEEFGKTYGGFVTIFKGTETEDYKGDPITAVSTGTVAEKELRDTLQASMRPKIILSSMPKRYVETDDSSWITKNDFVWNYEIKDASNVTVKVYYDEDGNGRFTDDEEKTTGSGVKGTVTMPADSFDDDFFGPVYWKFVAINKTTGTSVSTTNISKVKRTKESKMKVDLLEIFPLTDKSEKGDNSTETLMLCTECQMARRLCKHGNIHTTSGTSKYEKDTITQLSGSFDSFGLSSNNVYVNDTTKKILGFTPFTSTTAARSAMEYELKFTGNGQPFRYVNIWNNNSVEYKANLNDKINADDEITYSNLLNGEYYIRVWNGTDVTVSFNGQDYLLKNNDNLTFTIDDSTAKEFTISNIDKTGSNYNRTHFITDYLTNDDSNYVYGDHGDTLGIHEHKFGIVKYDQHETRTKTTGPDDYDNNGENFEGMDNWNTNWFLDFQNDYDVDMTLLSTRDFESYCKKVNDEYKSIREKKDYKDITDSDGNTITAFEQKKEELRKHQLTFSQNETKYETLYRCMVSVINGTYYTDNSGLSETDKTTFENYLKNEIKMGGYSINGNLVDYVNNPDDAAIKTLLQGWGGAAAKCDSYLLDNIDTLYNSKKIEATRAQAKSEFEYLADPNTLPDDKAYYFFFSLWKDTSENVTQDFARLYVNWRDAKILEQYFHQKYIENKIMASVYCEDDATEANVGTFNLGYAFNCVAIGAADNFGEDDINNEGCKVLENYAVNFGHLLLFHDSLTVSGVGSQNAGTPTMTSILSDDFGQAAVSDSTSLRSGYSVTQRANQYGSKGHEDQKKFISQQKYGYYDYETESNNQTLHGAHDVRDSIAGQEGYGVTSDRANQVNEGVITEYPFTIGENLQISPTAPAGYTANTDDKDVVVYYCISGGSLGTKSSMFAANPNDGANNYFLYQYKNVTYTGAGHSIITGVGRDNNDERRLFINVILNSARRSTAGPSLTLHDIDSTDDELKNNVIKDTYDASTESSNAADTEEYVTYVDSKDVTREFTFRPVSNNGIRSVRIWFDVVNSDSVSEKNILNEDDNSAGKKDVLIYTIDNTDTKPDNLKNNGIESKKVKKIYNGTGVDAGQGDVKLVGYTKQSDNTITTNLKLSEDYFTGQGGKCAYICVEITDNQGKVAEKTIRVETKAELIDLN